MSILEKHSIRCTCFFATKEGPIRKIENKTNRRESTIHNKNKIKLAFVKRAEYNQS